ncbi:hypothetical protein E4U19_002400 [Claviceps sp. Clav32 group G5]|nr:hypothetical protein E4U19_002400 [Claviceps sp. Clav32 group G5]KAG6045246.1 hypothetical protein E4U39_002566 [Claviceps sp. Clav50 group G5]
MANFSELTNKSKRTMVQAEPNISLYDFTFRANLSGFWKMRGYAGLTPPKICSAAMDCNACPFDAQSFEHFGSQQRSYTDPIAGSDNGPEGAVSNVSALCRASVCGV